MPTPWETETRFRLPTRIRNLPELSGSLTSRLNLADRIAEMPGVIAIENEDQPGAFDVRVMLTVPVHDEAKSAAARVLGEINRDGFVVHGLKRRDKHQVLSRGWGRLRKRSVLLYLPRDEHELDICWAILQRAYNRFMESTADRSPIKAVASEYPHHSRTSLQ